MTSLLPPNATGLERALDGAAGRLADIPVPIVELWDADTCPADLLPWLAWGLSIDTWEAGWTEAEKREQTRDALDRHRRKGTLRAVREAIDAHEPGIGLTEWWQDPTGQADPHTFELRIDLEGSDGERATAALIDRVVRDVTRVKPVRSHLVTVQALPAGAALGVLGRIRPAAFARLRAAVDTTSEPAWATYVLTEDGEPFEAEDGQLIQREESA